MRRQLNFRLLLTTLAVLGGSAAVFHVIHLWQFNRNATSLLAYARAAQNENKSEQALSLYGQYLKQVPTDLAVQEEYALVLDGVALTPASRNRVALLLENLLLKSSDRPKARERLVEILVLLGRYDAAVRHLEMLRSTARDRAEIEHKLGWCLDADGKSEAAAQAFRRALALDPRRVDSSIQLAEVLHHRLARDIEAQRVLDALVAANSGSAAVYLARYRYQHFLGHDAEATKDLEQARRLAPNDADVILAACQWAQANGQFDEARDLVARGAKLFPANEWMITQLATLELRQGRRELALKAVEDGLKALDNKTQTGELQVLHADLLIDAGQLKEAAAIIASLRQQGLAPALPDFLQARLLVEDNKWSQAQLLLDKARIDIGYDTYWNSRINALLAVCFAQLCDGDRQLASLLEAARFDPRWMAVNLHLAQFYLDADNLEQALTYFQLVLDDPEAPKIAYARRARALFRQTMRLPEKERRWRDVDAALDLADKRDPGSLDVALLRADICQAQRKPDRARAVLAAEIKKRSAQPRPDDLALWLAFADFEARDGDDDRAEQLLQDAAKRFGDRPALRLGNARFFIHRGRADDRDRLRALSDNTNEYTAEDRGRLNRDLAEIWLRLGDVAAARALLVRTAADLPRDARSRALLVDLDLQESKLDDARKWLKELQSIEGVNGSQAAYASLLIRVEDAFGQPEALQKLLAELKNSPKRRTDGRIELVEARIHERLGETDQARVKLMDAVAAGQRSPRVLRRLVRSLIESQDYKHLPWAISLLEGRGPMPREVGRAAVEAALDRQNLDQARDLLGPVDIQAIRDYRELLWLGRTYKAMGDRDLAEASLRHAVTVAPHAPDAWVALANQLVANDQRVQATELLENIERGKIPPMSRPMIRARLALALGDLKIAAAAFDAALKNRPNDFLTLLTVADFYRETDQPLRAESLYKKALDPGLATPPEVAARARRGLALTSPRPSADILAPNRTRNELIDDRLAFFIDGRDAVKRADSIRAFEESLPRGPVSAEESFWLAQLYDAAGQFDALAAVMDKIIASGSDTPRMDAFYARSLLRQSKGDEARPVVNRLLQREPDSPRSREIKATFDGPKKSATP